MATDYNWYKRDPAKFLAATVDFTGEEKGVYSTLIDLMYDRKAPLVDEGAEAGKLARICGVSTFRFRVIRDKLLDLPGKLKRTGDGRLSNDRFEREVRYRAASKDGTKDGASELETPEKNAKKTGEKTDLFSTVPSDPKDLPENPSRARAIRPREDSRLKTTESYSNGDRERDESRLAHLCRIMGIVLTADTRRAAWPRQLIELLEEGIDFDLDLVPIVERDHKKAAREITSLTYFRAAAREHRDARMRAQRVNTLNAPDTVDEATWQSRLLEALNRGAWSTTYGHGPLDPRCGAPRPLLDRFLAKWREIGEHPVTCLDETDLEFRPFAQCGRRDDDAWRRRLGLNTGTSGS